MSISSVCDRFTITIRRYASTKGASGQAKLAWSTANRTSDGLSISIRADMQTLNAEERDEYGVNDDVEAWRMYTASDPKLGSQDDITWLDSSSILRTCRILKPSTDSAGRGRLWKTIVEERKNLS